MPTPKEATTTIIESEDNIISHYKSLFIDRKIHLSNTKETQPFFTLKQGDRGKKVWNEGQEFLESYHKIRILESYHTFHVSFFNCVSVELQVYYLGKTFRKRSLFQLISSYERIISFLESYSPLVRICLLCTMKQCLHFYSYHENLL